MKHKNSDGHRPNPNGVLAPCARSNLIEQLFSDKTWINNYRVTDDERESLSNAGLMGEVTCERDVLFMLNQLRRARLRW
jgi:hypothetical protein